MNDDSQDDERRRSSTPPGSGRHGDEPSPATNAGTHEGQRSPGDDLQRVESDVQRNGHEVIDAELVEEVTRQIASSAYL